MCGARARWGWVCRGRGRTFWHERALTTGSVRGEKIEQLLDMFDSAKLICACNGRDVSLTCRCYAHSTEAMRRGGNRTAASSWIRLPRRAGRRADARTTRETIDAAAAQWCAGQAGRADTPGLWRAERLEQLQRYRPLQPMFHMARRRMWEGARTWDPGIW